MYGMAELMDQDITHQPAWKKKQLLIEADRPTGGAAAPAAALVADDDPFASETGLVPQLLKPGNQMCTSFASRPAAEGGKAGRQIIDRAGYFQQPVLVLADGGAA